MKQPSEVYELLLRRVRGVGDDTLNAMDEYMLSFFRKVQRAAPRSRPIPGQRRHGHSADRMHLFQEGNPDHPLYRIYADSPIWWTVTGTPAHDIYPRTVRHRDRQGRWRGGVLRWQDAGGTHFAQHVHHPGTAPQSWLHDVVRDFNFPKFMVVRLPRQGPPEE